MCLALLFCWGGSLVFHICLWVLRLLSIADYESTKRRKFAVHQNNENDIGIDNVVAASYIF